jgi:hypothetical protein
MTQQAEARIYEVEQSPEVERGVREQIASTAQAMAATDQHWLPDALESVSWERRGFLKKLSKQPRT